MHNVLSKTKVLFLLVLLRPPQTALAGITELTLIQEAEGPKRNFPH